MKKYLFSIILVGILAGRVSAQYDASELQNKINNDKAIIALEQNDINARNAEIQNIINDNQVNTIINFNTTYNGGVV